MSACPGCAAPMSDDQRYCLACGERRGEPRVPLPRHQEREELAAATEPVAVAPVRRNATPAWVAAVGVLLLAMGVGVLIGHQGNSEVQTAAPAAPVTVTVPAGGVAATPTPSDTAEAADKSKAKDAKVKKAKGKGAPVKPVATASQEELQQLDDLSPEEYNKKSKALPDEVGTSGTPVPKDDKAPGAGSDVEAIG